MSNHSFDKDLVESANAAQSANQIHQTGGISFGQRNEVNITGDVVHGDKIGQQQVTNVFGEDQAYNVAGLPNPYLGLNPFTYNERSCYAGREHEVASAVKAMTAPGAQRVLFFITGASGSGKSSFVQAGLLPALEAHYKERGRTLHRLPIVRPGSYPLAQIKEALAPLGVADFAAWPDRHTLEPYVLVLDQFEEFFTQSPAEQRQTIFNQLAQLPEFEVCQLHIIATLRSDYLEELFASASLWAIAKQGAELRGMSEAALKEAIQRPLQSRVAQDPAFAGKRFEPALVDKLAQQAAAEPSLLPLLQVTLDELWRNKKRLALSSYAYEQNGVFVRDGTLTDAIKKRADTVLRFIDFDELYPNHPRSNSDQRVLLNLFLSLVRVSLDDDYRRDVRTGRRLSLLPSDQQKLVQDLVRARLLSISSQRVSRDSAAVNYSNAHDEVEIVNIIHESLINNWDALREGIREERLQLQRRERFEQDLRDWLANGQSDSYLLKDLALARAQALERIGDVALSGEPLARALLQRSTQVAEAEQQRRIQQANQQERSRSLWQTLGLMLGTGTGYATCFSSVVAYNGIIAGEEPSTLIRIVIFIFFSVLSSGVLVGFGLSLSLWLHGETRLKRHGISWGLGVATGIGAYLLYLFQTNGAFYEIGAADVVTGAFLVGLLAFGIGMARRFAAHKPRLYSVLIVTGCGVLAVVLAWLLTQARDLPPDRFSDNLLVLMAQGLALGGLTGLGLILPNGWNAPNRFNTMNQ